MVTRAKSTPVSKKKASTKKPMVKSVATKKTTNQSSPKPVVSQKVDYYPNRMTLAVSVLAGTLLVLVSLIAVLGMQ